MQPEKQSKNKYLTKLIRTLLGKGHTRPKKRFDVMIQELVLKVQNSGVSLREKNVFLGLIFGFFTISVLLRGHFCTDLHEIWAPGLKLNFMTTLLSDPCRGSDLETAFWLLFLFHLGLSSKVSCNTAIWPQGPLDPYIS